MVDAFVAVCVLGEIDVLLRVLVLDVVLVSDGGVDCYVVWWFVVGLEWVV